MKADPLRVALRADASAKMGLGHVKRCLALGQALQEAGARVCLISRELGVDIASLAGSGCVDRVTLCPPRPSAQTHPGDKAHAAEAQVDWAEDAEETVAALRPWGADLVVVDHYSFDARWHRAVSAALDARIAAIDDLGDRDLAVDWLIDHNLASDHQAKYVSHLAPGTKLLCGPRYALLAPVYATAARHAFRPSVDSIGIFMGGADSSGLSSKVVLACRQVAGFGGRIEVATTRANPHLAELKATCFRWPPATLTVDAPDLASFFARHDLQIGAGGGATWERCCIGSPTLALICADNQRGVISALAQTGAIATLSQAEEPTVASIGHAVATLLEDSERRAVMSERALQLVDGLGARRVALHLAASTLALHPASAADAALMHAWRNHPLTRAMSHDRQEIAWLAHVQWLDSVLADPMRLLLIASIGTIPVGVIRFDRQSSEQATVSLYLDPALHGLGLGTAMLLSGERHACTQPEPPTHFEATVLEANTGSQRMFTSAGYRQDGDRWIKVASPPLFGETST